VIICCTRSTVISSVIQFAPTDIVSEGAVKV
jgi:hypothetical protein